MYCGASTSRSQQRFWRLKYVNLKKKPIGRSKRLLEGTIKMVFKMLGCVLKPFGSEYVPFVGFCEKRVEYSGSMELRNWLIGLEAASFWTTPFPPGISRVIFVVSLSTCFILNGCGCLFYVFSSDVPKVIRLWKVSDIVLRVLQIFIFLYLIINFQIL